MEIEFQNPFDYKDSGSFPVPGENGEVYLPFFVFQDDYPMGPFVFTVGMYLNSNTHYLAFPTLVILIRNI